MSQARRNDQDAIHAKKLLYADLLHPGDARFTQYPH
jgi:hypothetical protein